MYQESFLRLPQVLARVGFGRSHLYSLVSRGLFPQPLKLGRIAAWRSSDIDSWIARQITAAQGQREAA